MKTNNLKNILKITIFSLSIFFITIANSFAQTDNGLQGSLNFKAAATNITDNVLTSAVTLLMTAAFVLFFWGVVRFLYDRSNGEDAKLAKDKEAMLWGLGALFVMVSVWGIIKMFQGFLGIENDNNIKIQSVQFIKPSEGQGGSEPVKLPEPGDFNTDINAGDPITKDKAKKIDGYLSQYGCFPKGIGSIGASYDNEDTYLIKEFQRANNLNINGVIDANTWKAFEGTSNKCDYSKTVIKAPIQTPAADALFQYLKYYRCTNGSGVDYGTTYGEEDTVYTKKFQKANSLKEDGIVGSDTWKKLMSDTARKCE